MGLFEYLFQFYHPTSTDLIEASDYIYIYEMQNDQHMEHCSLFLKEELHFEMLMGRGVMQPKCQMCRCVGERESAVARKGEDSEEAVHEWTGVCVRRYFDGV